MNEITKLNNDEDKYADATERCEQCHLPKLVVTYELGFQALQEQLIELRKDLQKLVNRIDTLDYQRTISRTDSQ